MVVFILRHHNQINSCQKLHYNVRNTKKYLKCVNDAWKMNLDYEKNDEPCDCIEAIPEGLRLVLDGKRFLGLLGTCLDQEKCLNCTGRLKTVCDFSSNFLNLVLSF